MFDEIKYLNEKNKEKTHKKVRILYDKNEYRCYLVDDRNYRMSYFENLGELYKILSLEPYSYRNYRYYITNLSRLKNIKRIQYYCITIQDWLDIKRYLTSIHSNSFKIIKVNNIREYISRLVITKKVVFLHETEAYKLIFVNDSDLILVSSVMLKVRDNVEMVFDGYMNYLYIDNLDVSELTDMSFMFHDLQYVEKIILKNFDTRKVKTFGYFFADCCKLRIVNLEELRTDSATTLEGMFENCSSLETVNINHFDITNVYNFKSMFYHCIGLKKLDLSKWDFESSYNRFRKQSKNKDYTLQDMFNGCRSLSELNIQGLKSLMETNVNVTYMIKNCHSLIKERFF